jgi:hypothetical protein
VLAPWKQVLSPGLDMHDDRFTMGGHSLWPRIYHALSREQVTLPLPRCSRRPQAAGLRRSGCRAPARLDVARSRGRADTRRSASLHGRAAPALASTVPSRSGWSTWRASRRAAASALRTSVGTAMQVELALPTIDLRGLPADQREAELADRMQELADRPIDIHAAPMAHAALFQLDDEDHAFVFVPHQLVWDDASFVLLQRELRALYDHARCTLCPRCAPTPQAPCPRSPARRATTPNGWPTGRRPRPSRHSSASGGNAPPLSRCRRRAPTCRGAPTAAARPACSPSASTAPPRNACTTRRAASA